MLRTSNHNSLNRLLLIHTAGVAAVVVLVGGIWKASTGLRAKELCLHEELRFVTDLISNDRNIRAQHDRLAKEIQLLHDAARSPSSAISLPPNDATLLAELSKLANSVELSIKSYSPGQSSVNGLEVQVSATASYAGICRFLNGLSATNFLCEVTQCSLAAPQQDDGLCTLELALRVVNPAQVRATLAAAGRER